MASAKRPGLLVPVGIPLALASVTGVVTAYVTGAPVDVPIPDAVRREAAAELASQMPWATSETSPVELSVTSSPEAYEVALGSRECAVLILTALDHRLEVTVRAPSLPPGAARAHQWDREEAFAYCSGPEAETVAFDIAAATPLPSRVLVDERRAPADEEHNLFTLGNRLYTADFLEARWARILEQRARDRQREGTGDGEVVAGPVVVDSEHGPLVLPLDEVTMHAVDEAAQLGLAEKTPATYPGQDGEEQREGQTLPTVRWGDTRWRILAAVDARAFEHCVTVEHWPQVFAEASPPLNVLYLPSGRVETAATTIATVCPEDGVAIIGTEPVDLDYRVIVRRGAEAAPQPRAPVELTDTEPFRDDLERCEAGDTDRCVATARRLLTGDGVTANGSRAEEMTALACEQSAAECWAAAGYGEGPRRVRLLERACEDGGDKIACRSLGDHYRLGLGTPVDYQGAWAAYRRACGVSQAACTAAENLVRVGLATAEAGL